MRFVPAGAVPTPPRPEPDDPFPVVDWDDPENQDMLRRARWVTETLLDLDFSLDQIKVLILVPDVRAKAARLRGKGMPHDLIVNELID